MARDHQATLKERLSKRVVEATYSIVLPMFIGDAHQLPTSVRAPSVRGALRFWWRALNWGPMLAESRGVETAGLKALHTREAELFGESARPNRGGQGCFHLQVVRQPHLQRETVWPASPSGPQSRKDATSYLGFGLWESGSEERDNYQAQREAIHSGSFRLQLVFRPDATEDQMRSVKEALETWGLLGGLGSRSRRGFGSVQLTELAGKPVSYSRQDYTLTVKEHLRRFEPVLGYPPFTAFSQKARFVVLAQDPHARKVMAAVGRKYRDFRSQGNGLTLDQRRAFGLPIQGLPGNERRASPLFFHVHKVRNEPGRGGGRHLFLAGALFLPAEFHPDHPVDDLNAFYHPVRKFMEVAELTS